MNVNAERKSKPLVGLTGNFLGDASKFWEQLNDSHSVEKVVLDASVLRNLSPVLQNLLVDFVPSIKCDKSLREHMCRKQKICQLVGLLNAVINYYALSYNDILKTIERLKKNLMSTDTHNFFENLLHRPFVKKYQSIIEHYISVLESSFLWVANYKHRIHLLVYVKSLDEKKLKIFVFRSLMCLNKMEARVLKHAPKTSSITAFDRNSFLFDPSIFDVFKTFDELALFVLVFLRYFLFQVSISHKEMNYIVDNLKPTQAELKTALPGYYKHLLKS